MEGKFKMNSPILPHFQDNIWLWLLVPLILILAVSILRTRRGIISAALRFIALSLLILSLAKPYYSTRIILDKDGVVALIDNSMSMTNEAIKSCEKQILSGSKGKKVETLYFANTLEQNNNNSRLYLLTNYEESLQKAISKFSGADLIICTDGRETKGNFENSAKQVLSSFKSISLIYPDSVSLIPNQIEITNLTLPLSAKKSEIVTLRFTARNRTLNKFAGDINIQIDSQNYRKVSAIIDKQTEKKFEIRLENLIEGDHKITVTAANNPTESSPTAAQWIHILETPSVLLFSKQATSSVLLEKLLNTLQIEFIKIDPANYSGDPKLTKEKITGVILNNVKANEFNSQTQNNLSSFVESGGGLLILGGDSSFGIGGYQNTILEKLSPLKSVPPRSKIARAPSAVILLIDKSGSMGEQSKLHSAKLAALSSINSLKSDDYVGLIGFDYAPLSIIDLDKVEKVKLNARERLVNLTAYGQTNLLPGLSLARLRLSKITAAKKHVIILSDGRFPNSSDAFVAEINRMRNDGVTISTVALGLEADAPFMKMLAQAGKGSFYQTIDSRTLPKLFVDDIKVAVGEDTMKEESNFPVAINETNQKLRSLAPFPNILGFIETEPKPNAQIELSVSKAEQKFPLFGFWNYGQGAVSAFSSDLQGRWTGPWLRWQNFVSYWNYAIRKTLRKEDDQADSSQYDIRYQITGGRIKFEAFIYDKDLERRVGSKIPIEIKLGNNQHKFELEEKVTGRFENFVRVDEAGDYDLKIKLDEDKVYKLAILAQDLGENSIAGIDYNFLNDVKNKINAHLGIISYEADNKLEKSKTSKSDPYTLPFLICSVIFLILEVLIRERGIKS